MFAVRYRLAGIWHVVPFTRHAPAESFLRACVRAMPRHVQAVEYLVILAAGGAS